MLRSAALIVTASLIGAVLSGSGSVGPFAADARQAAADLISARWDNAARQREGKPAVWMFVRP